MLFLVKGLLYPQVKKSIDPPILKFTNSSDTIANCSHFRFMDAYRMHAIDWTIIAAFIAALTWISIATNRATKTVAGFLSSERKAGRYLLTVAGSMAFCSAIGIVADFEGRYQNGIAGYWWGTFHGPFVTLILMTGWVIYRYRQTRCLTMAEFLERRYNRKFRLLAGITAFISGMLNCAIFPMVTANFLIYYLQLPLNFELLGITFSTFHCMMLLMISGAIILAISGGQITIMVTDFLQGSIASFACIALVGFVLYKFGWTNLIDTMGNSELIDPEVTPDIVSKVTRTEGASVMNPFKLEGWADFGIAFFVMRLIVEALQVGVWQGGAGYLTSARTPHEARMGGMLYGWRWLVITMGTLAVSMSVYTFLWNPQYSEGQAVVQGVLDTMRDSNNEVKPYLQSQMVTPVALAQILPPGLLGLFAIYMIGASISTDNSAYHSWGSVFLQDVIMPFRKTPFGKEQHLRYLRYSIIGIGAFAFILSSTIPLKDYIHMWFAITGAIYVGGAACAIIGGLYWKYGTTKGAFAGMITGSVLSVTGVITKQVLGEDFIVANTVVNGLHIAVACIAISFSTYFIVSLLTCKKPTNLDKLLHRGEYVLDSDLEEKEEIKRSWIARKLGVTNEFSRWDKVVYYASYTWIFFWLTVFVVGTVYNYTNEVSSESWKKWWAFHLGTQATAAAIIGVWFFFGGLRDVRRLFNDLKTIEEDNSDDGFVR